MAASSSPKSPQGGIRTWLRRALAVPEVHLPLVGEAAPVKEMACPDTLSIFLGRSDFRGPLLSPAVHEGDDVTLRAPLGRIGEREVCPSPVAGRVVQVRNMPDVRGGKPGFGVSLEPASSGERSLLPLDALGAPVPELRDRLRAVGVADPGEVASPARTDLLVVLAADSEPGLSATLWRFVDDPAAAVRAAAAAGRLAGVDRVMLAVVAPHEITAHAVANGTGVEVLPLAPEYPASLPARVACRAAAVVGNGGRAAPRPPVIPLATALDALEAWERGRAPTHRVLTVLGPDREPVGNFRVPIGTRLADVLTAAGLAPGPGDLVVIGGPMRGLAQYSLDACVDPTVDALLLLRAGTFAPWTEEPCVNCGLCLDVCPESLQAHHLARLAEFDLFERTVEYGLHDCIECGLCATVCPARRPLLQRIRLAKREVAAAQAAALVALAAEGEPKPREPDPIQVPFTVARKD